MTNTFHGRYPALARIGRVHSFVAENWGPQAPEKREAALSRAFKCAARKSRRAAHRVIGYSLFREILVAHHASDPNLQLLAAALRRLG